MKSKFIFTHIFYLVFFIFGGISYYLFFDFQTGRDLRNYQTSSVVRKNTDNKLIYPLLLTGDTKSSFVDDNFTKKISEYISNQKKIGNAAEISYYVKNLRNSSWTSVNEDAHYAPASLMKVPILIAILKESERNPGFLKKEIKYIDKKNYNEDEYYFPAKSIQPNNTYTVEELLRFMIETSDNNAAILLISLIPPKNIIQIFTDLELPLPPNGSNQAIDFMSTKLYSRLFRVLYNSTYLNEEDSTKALEMLSNIDFKNGIISRLPPEVNVANKFGERTVNDGNGKVLYRELHDCGIVYLTNNPYAVCIMTRGQEFPKLEKIIQDLSQMTYEDLK